jgi:phenylpropionate dioxygenase-like ring-hydroxylating dioxygenase large terminal subunit
VSVTALPRYPFTQYPRGWFRVGGSADLRPGDVRSIRYFGRDLVLFRAREAGTAHVLDAYCPHLGANLGIGGCVEGDAVVCPFHRWSFDGGGACVAVPYATKVPKTGVRSWTVREVNGQIMMWHPIADEAPTWEFPEFREMRAPDRTPLRAMHRWSIRSHPQELAENGMDLAHFACVHGQQTLTARSSETRADGPTFVHLVDHTYRVFPLARLWVNEVRGPLEITFNGPGCAVNRALVDAKIQLDYCMPFFFTPIDEERVEVTSFLSMKKLKSRIATYLLARKASKEAKITIDQDIPIWETKVYRDKPVLCDGDGPIPAFRQWIRQFYA